MKKLFVSVIIPVRELSSYLLLENFPAMAKQTYRKFEVIVLPNKKSQMDTKLLRRYKWLRIIPTNKITRPAEKRDIGVRDARGDIIAFIDDDAYPPKGWVEKAVLIFEKKNIAAICGPGLLPQKTNTWERIFDEVLKSFFGSGGYQYRFIKGVKRYVDDYPSMNFFIRKNLFDSLGGFSNEYWPGEDSKLCEDIVYKKKEKIYYDPDIYVYHHRRTDLRGFLNQHGRYGFHRGAFFSHGDKNSRRLSYLIPTFFVLYIFLFLFYFLSFIFYHYHLLSIIYYLLLPLLVYLFFMIYLSIRSYINTKNLFVSFVSPFVLLLTHLIYGIMFIRGIIVGIIKKERIYG